eukprot:GHVL01028663.1.p2 GENE.GHVL01028663.1~~GHVL01028663.1.p2  ORF type:complete len:158 (+),score=37.55 GHVL01028663.1:141-614(+)
MFCWCTPKSATVDKTTIEDNFDPIAALLDSETKSKEIIQNAQQRRLEIVHKAREEADAECNIFRINAANEIKKLQTEIKEESAQYENDEEDVEYAKNVMRECESKNRIASDLIIDCALSFDIQIAPALRNDLLMEASASNKKTINKQVKNIWSFLKK